MDGKIKKEKLIYVLPLYKEDTDTHFRHLYGMIAELAKNLDIFVIVEKGSKAQIDGIAGSVILPENIILRMIFCIYYLFNLRLKGYKKCYVHYSFPGVFLSKLACLKVFYWNCGQAWLFPGINNKIILPLILRMADILVTGTNFMARGYADNYRISLDKIRIIPNWVEINKWSQIDSAEVVKFRSDLKIPSDHKVILFVHRLSPRKGSVYLPKIWQAFADYEEVDFIIAGDGPDKNWLLDECAHAKNSGRIHLLGSVPNNQLPRIMHASDIFIMPSGEEGFPRVVIEAMACGLPVVAFDTGGLEEVMIKENISLLTKIGDIENLNKNIKSLFEQRLDILKPDLRKRASSFDISVVKNKFLDLIMNH